MSRQGGVQMIRFDKLWKTMEQKNMTTYQLREKCYICSVLIKTAYHICKNE